MNETNTQLSRKCANINGFLIQHSLLRYENIKKKGFTCDSWYLSPLSRTFALSFVYVKLRRFVQSKYRETVSDHTKITTHDQRSSVFSRKSMSNHSRENKGTREEYF